jgi:hypothetical protein
MSLKRGALLIVALLAMLSHGCAMESGSVPLDLIRPSDPSFTQDSSPASPNYYWIEPKTAKMNNNFSRHSVEHICGPRFTLIVTGLDWA